MTLGLARPTGLSDTAWAAVSEAERRLQRALDAHDDALVIGCAKDLCESVARVIIDARGEVPIGDDMPDLLNATHKALAYQPGEDLANDPEARKIATALKTLVHGLVELRNRHGTGHGHGQPIGVTTEHAELALNAAGMWSRWALRRLEPYMAGAVTPLVRELDDGEIFKKGELRRRLAAANLRHLTPDDQRRLGTAIGRRTARGTWNVAIEGVHEIDAQDGTTWPWAYVESVMGGLLFDANGFLRLGESPKWTVHQLARLTAEHPERIDILRGIATRIAQASAAGRVATEGDARAAAAAAVVAIAEPATNDAERAIWREMQVALAPPADAA